MVVVMFCYKTGIQLHSKVMFLFRYKTVILLRSKVVVVLFRYKT